MDQNQQRNLGKNIANQIPMNSQTNATSAIMHLLMQAIWGDIWKSTAEKSQTDATDPDMNWL